MEAANNGGGVLSSFQKNEALVYTDNSGKYLEWPAGAGSETMRHRNGRDVSFVPTQECRGLGAAPQPMGLTQPVRPNTTSSSTPRFSEGISPPSTSTKQTNNEEKEKVIRAPLAKAAAAKKKKKTPNTSRGYAMKVETPESDFMGSTDTLQDPIAEKEMEQEPEISAETYLQSVLRKAEDLLGNVANATRTKKPLENKVEFIGTPHLSFLFPHSSLPSPLSSLLSHVNNIRNLQMSD